MTTGALGNEGADVGRGAEATSRSHVTARAGRYATNRALLIHGLRPQLADNGDTEHDLWRRMSDALLSSWPQPIPSRATAWAERGLRIAGTPYYFFVMRTHGAYGLIVFLFEDASEETNMPPTAMGATPFDSGGLWIGKIDPITDDGDKQEFFAAEDVPLAHWKSNFFDYIGNNYGAPQDYVHGEPPRVGTPPITNQRPRNSSRAWTWEVRYPCDLASARLRFDHAYMHREEYDAYFDWLPRSDYEDAKIDELTQLVDERVAVHNDDDMAYKKARTILADLFDGP